MATPSRSTWQLWVDTGGTFTDCLAQCPTGRFHRVKVLSSGRLRATLKFQKEAQGYHLTSRWSASQNFLRGTRVRTLADDPSASIDRIVTASDPLPGFIQLDAPLPPSFEQGSVEIVFDEEAPIVAAHLITGTPFEQTLPPIEMRLATTKATNALLERKGERTVFFVTAGFRDLLRIGNQQRPHLFDLEIKRHTPLHDTVVEVNERLDAAGQAIVPLEVESLTDTVRRLYREGYRTAAVALIHAYKNPQHERQLCALLDEAGFDHVSLSHELAPMIKILPRAETAVTNAYLAPLMGKYLGKVSAALAPSALNLMTSAGGIVPATAFRPKDALLSGPAGGVVGAATTGQELGIDHIIAFDMGGTSTDVSRFDSNYDYQFEHQVGPARLLAPALRIETVAAGGGSICGFNSQGLFVGPESAGATPGPACYGAGGPLSITDVNLLLNRMDPREFGIPISPEAAQQALDAVVAQITNNGETAPDPVKLLQGFLDIANERMADAIRSISVREGYDPRDYALVAFGGAGGQHACAVADRLGIKTILFAKQAGLLSAHGLRHAIEEQFAERQVLAPLNAIIDDLPQWIDALETNAREQLGERGIPQAQTTTRRRILQLRFVGQEATEDLELSTYARIEASFRERYRSVFGYDPQDKEVELVSIRVTAAVCHDASEHADGSAPGRDTPPKEAPSLAPDNDREGPSLIRRHELQSGQTIAGPAIVQDAYSTIVIESGWNAMVEPNETLHLTRTAPATKAARTSDSQLVEEELFTHRFESLVGDMGSQLERTSVSTNVKDRLDFSCALLDAQGELIANAPHIPVHLGALGICTRTVSQHIDWQPGDMIVTNHPGFGGSHLPDVTVISPVHDDHQQLVGFVANRAHHAEIGGLVPGSMPPNASRLIDEGIVIPPTYLFHRGDAQWETMEQLLGQGPHPSRAIADNLADLRAQAAANHKGSLILKALCRDYGSATIQHHFARLKERAGQAMRHALRLLPVESQTIRELLDDGTPIVVTIQSTGDQLEIDFAGSGEQHPQNFNATTAIVTSAVLYTLRLLVQQPLPLNEGLMKPVTLNVPRGFLNPHFPEDPKDCPAVVAGNVETSQRVVDALIRALGIAAGSQGTMNNLIFGNERVSYYETIAGGAGAGPGFEGASGVHTHMTNTGITDPEILESRFPVRLDEFAIRTGSGGRGEYSGGDGIRRRLTFTDGVSVSLVTQHRVSPPYGMHGGAPGQCGQQRVLRTGAPIEPLGPTVHLELNAGDTLEIETPGGGAWGNLKPGPDTE